MNPKRQCQRTKPHSSHDWIKLVPIDKCSSTCTVCPDESIHYFNCEGVNFVEFKVGDKVRTKVFEVTAINQYDKNPIQIAMPRNDSGTAAYSFCESALELVERPEPPLPDWLTDPKPGEAIIAGDIVWCWTNQGWKTPTFNSPNTKCFNKEIAYRWYHNGQIKRLVPES